jgi:hypothetical protein
MTSSDDTYRSLKEVRAEFYPNSAELVDLGAAEVVDFPTGLTDEVNEIARRLAEKAEEQSQTAT